MKKSSYRKLWGLEELFGCSVAEKSNRTSDSLERTMTVEALESRVLLTADASLTTDETALLEASSTTLDSFTPVYTPSGTESKISIPGGTSAGAFVFQAGMKTNTYEFSIGTGTSTVQYDINIRVTFQSGIVESHNFTAKLLDANKKVVAKGEINGDTISFNGLTYSGGTSLTLYLSRTENTTEQTSFAIKAYQVSMSKTAEVATQTGTFAKSYIQTTNSYTFSMTKGSYGSIEVYAPESQNVTVELYHGSTKIANGISTGDGYYSIPTFWCSSDSGTTQYTVSVIGGSNVRAESYQLTVSKNGVTETELDNSRDDAIDLVKADASIYASISGTATDFTRTAINIGVASSTGYGSAIAYDSNILVTSTPKLKSSDSAVYLFSPNMSDEGWTQIGKWTIPTECATDGSFGTSLDINGDWIVAGASNDSVNGIRTGSVYVYNIQTKKYQRLTASDGQSSDLYGSNVLIYDDWLFVTAMSAQGGATKSGAVYVYHLDNSGTWQYSQKLVSETNIENANFGYSMDCDGQSLVISAPMDSSDGTLEADGVVYTYALRGTSWTQTQTITLSSFESLPGSSTQTKKEIMVGYCVSLSNGRLAIGTPGYKNGNANGIVGMFQRDESGTWNWTDTLYQTSGFVDEFGKSVDLADTQLVVGAPGLSCSAYVMNYSGSTETWTLSSEIDSDEITNFGQNVLIAGNKIIVSSPTTSSSVTSDQLLQSYTGLGDIDYYQLNIVQKTDIDCTIKIAPLNGISFDKMDICLLDSNGEVVTGAVTSTISTGGTYTTCEINLPDDYQSGTYYFRVASNVGTTGTYNISVKGSTADAFTASLQSPSGTTPIAELPDELVFTFNEVIDYSTLSSATLKVNNNVIELTSTNCTLVDGRTLSVKTSSISSLSGNLSMTFSGISSLIGSTISNTPITLYVDKEAPQLTSESHISVDGVTKQAWSFHGSAVAIDQGDQTQITLVFSSDINLPENATTVKRWVSIVNSQADNIDFDLSLDSENHTIVLTINQQLGDSSYTIKLSDDFVDMAGNKLDSASANWTFYVNSTEAIALPATTAGMTNGALLYKTSMSGTISQASETDDYTIHIDKGNMYSVYIIPHSKSSLIPSVTVKNGTTTIKTGKASYSGEYACVEGLVASNSSNLEYTISVTGNSSSTGGYTIYVVLNGMLNLSPSSQKSLSNKLIWYSPTFASSDQSKPTSYIANILGNYPSVSSQTSSKYTVQIATGDCMSIVLNPGENTGAKVGVYSLSTCSATSQIAEGYVNQNGLLVIDPIYNTSKTSATYYIKVSGVDSEYQLTAIRNGVLSDALDSGDLSQSSIYNSSKKQGQVYVYGHTSYLSDTISDSDLQVLVKEGTSSGVSVSISGDWAAVGCESESTGSVNLYNRTGQTWTLIQTLSGSELNTSGNGLSVSLDGSTLAVGVPSATKGGKIACGAVYLYSCDGTNWTKSTTISPEDYSTKDGCLFGAEVCLCNGFLAVGATNDVYNGSVCGSVYMYQISNTNGNVTATYTQRLLAGKDNGTVLHDASVCEQFGYSIDMDGNWLIVGSPNDFIYNTGAAYVYYYDGVHWAQYSVICPSGLLEYGDGFGSQVAIEGNTIAISAPYRTTTIGSESVTGTVFIYTIPEDGSAPQLSTQINLTVTGVTNFGSSIELADGQLLASGWTSSEREESKVWVYFINSDGTATQYSSTNTTDGQTIIGATEAGVLFSRPDSGTVMALNSLSEIQNYSFTVATEGNIVSNLDVPSKDTSGEFSNTLSALVSITDENGTAYYSDSTFPAGTYYIQTKAFASKTGDYIYYLGYPRSTSQPRLEGTFELTGFANGLNNRVQQSTSTIDLTFNAQIDISTLVSALTSGEITINGVAVSSTGFEIVDGHTVRLTVPTSGTPKDGQYVVVIAEGALSDVAGRTIAQTEQTLIIDSVHEGVSIDNIKTSTGERTLTITLNEGLLSEPSIDDLSLVGTKSGTINITKVSYNSTANKLYVIVSSLPDDYYTLTLKSSSGAFADLAGNWLDGSTTQEGIQDYVLNFYADWSTAQTVGYTSSNYTNSYTKQAVETSINGHLYSGNADAYKLINIPAGSTFNIYLETTDGLEPTLYVYQGTSESGTPLEPQYSGKTTSGAWQYGFTQSVASSYYVVLKNETTTEGCYTIYATLNGQHETESIGSSNNIIENAEPIIGLDKSSDTTVIRGNLATKSDVDWYSFKLEKGNWINLYLTKYDNNSVTMEVYANGTKILTGTQTEDFNQVIRNLVETAEDGTTYSIKISGTAGEYELLAAVGTVFNQDKDGSAVIAHNNSWINGSLDKTSGSENTFVETGIIASDKLGRGAFFGSSVDIDDCWMIVGGRYANQEGISSGYAAIYSKGAAGWTEFQEITPDDLSSNDQLGYSVSIEGNVAIVCSPIKQSGGYIGQAYIYEYQQGKWTNTAILNQFGSDIVFALDCQVISDSKIVIGSSSQATYYVKDSSGDWKIDSSMSILQGDVRDVPEEYSLEGFGSSVSVYTSENSNIMVVGAANSDYYVTGTGWVENLGLAFVYEYNSQSNKWESLETLELLDSSKIKVQANSGFGTEVLVYGDYVIVSAPNASIEGFESNGAVYIYHLQDDSLVFDEVLFGGQDGEMFGSSIAMNDSCLVVGSMYYSFQVGTATLMYTGKATVFELNSAGEWVSQQSVLSGETTQGAFVGAALALDGDMLAVGAIGQRPENTIDSPRSGVVFTYSLANNDDQYTCYIDATKAINVTINKGNSPISSLSSVRLYYRKANSTTETEAELTTTSTGWKASISSKLGSGDYVFRIVNDGETSGEYSMQLSNAGIDSTTALKPTSVTPAEGSKLDYKTQTVSVTFSDAIRPDLITLEQQPIVVTCSGSEITVKSISLSSDGKTVEVALLDTYPYKNENIQITFKKDNFVTINGAVMATDYVLNYVIPLETVAVSYSVDITEQQFQIAVTFDEDVELSAGKTWYDVVSFKMYYEQTEEFVEWTPTDRHFSYDKTTHTITFTSTDTLTEDIEYRMYLDGNSIFGVSGQPLAELVDNQYVIPFIKTDATMSVNAIVSTASTASTDPTGQSTSVTAAECVNEWESFYLELWAQADTNSVGELSLKVTYDDNLFELATNEDGSFVYQTATAFSGDNGTFSVKRVNGQIIVTAQTNVENMGTGENQVLLGRLQFVPTEEGKGVAIDAFQTGDFPTTGITVTANNLGRTKDGKAVNQNVTQATTEVWPVIYDMDDSQKIDSNDFLIFATNYGTVPTRGNDSWYTDFDSSWKTDSSDFISFATNYGNSRKKGYSLSMPDNYVEKMKARLASDATVAMATINADIPETILAQSPVEIPVPIEVEQTPVEMVKVETIHLEQITPVVASNSANLNVTMTIQRPVTEEQLETMSSEQTDDVSPLATVLSDEDSFFDWDDALADSTPVTKTPIDVVLEELL